MRGLWVGDWVIRSKRRNLLWAPSSSFGRGTVCRYGADAVRGPYGGLSQLFRARLRRGQWEAGPGSAPVRGSFAKSKGRGA